MAVKTTRSYAWSILVLFLIIGWIYPVVGIMAIICMTAPVAVALVSGKRKWCAMFCPRGIFNDVILAKISRRRKVPAILTSNYFKTGFLIFLMANLVVGIVNARGDLAAIGFVFVRLVSLTTAIAIVLGYIYSQRTWCGFCPMGFLATLGIKAGNLIRKPRRVPELSPAQKQRVILYTGENCPACDRVKEMLQRLKIVFQEVNIDRNKSARDALVAGHRSAAVPALVVDGKLIKDMSDDNLQKQLAENVRLAG